MVFSADESSPGKILKTDPDTAPILMSQPPKNPFLMISPSILPSNSSLMLQDFPKEASLAQMILAIHSACCSRRTEMKKSWVVVVILIIRVPGTLLSALTLSLVMLSIDMSRNASSVIVASSMASHSAPTRRYSFPK